MFETVLLAGSRYCHTRRSFSVMNLSNDVSCKVVESCRVIQLVLPFLAIAALIFLGFVFSDFQGPMLTNKQPNQGSLFFAGVAFFLATVVTPISQRLLLTKLFQKQTNTDEQQAIRVTKILQLTVLAACVFLSLAAYANISAFGSTKDVVHLVVVGFLLIAILARIPSQVSFRQQLDRVLREQMEAHQNT